MSDVYNKAMRSAVMSKIRSNGNKSTELRLIDVLHSQDITGWRRNYPVKGHPDFVFLKKRIAVFVDGCFWHGHNCRNTRPKENKDFWTKKIGGNIKRDNAVNKRFKNRGWTVLRIWECELKKKNRDSLINKLSRVLHSQMVMVQK